MNVEDVREILLTAERSGADVDEPEGARYIRISDNLALRMADALGARAPILRRAGLFFQQLGAWLRENG